MAFQAENLSVLGYANGFTLWHYRTEDSEASITADATYFLSAYKVFKKSDFLMLNSDAGYIKGSFYLILDSDETGVQLGPI